MNRFKKAFTLVEILIVVIILGILAAIVIPQFTQASSDARDSALTSDLQTLRSQLALYRVQHLDQVPAAANFEALMTKKSTVAGVVDEAAGTLGPYMQTVPNNPVTGVNTIATGTTAPTSGASTGGWIFVTGGVTDSTSNIYANDDGKTTSGTLHVKL